jgi:hypothetical protein
VKLPLTSAGLLVERDAAALGADGDRRPNVARLGPVPKDSPNNVGIVERTGMAGYGCAPGT